LKEEAKCDIILFEVKKMADQNQHQTNKRKQRIWPSIIIITIGIAILVIGVIEHLALIFDNPNAKWHFLKDADHWIALIGGILPYVGTCAIGIISVWQNGVLSEVNDRLLAIEESRIIPRLSCKVGEIRHYGKIQDCILRLHMWAEIPQLILKSSN